jgi:dienelactone hydrolase
MPIRCCRRSQKNAVDLIHHGYCYLQCQPSRARPLMQSPKSFFVLVVLLLGCAQRATAQELGAQGAESEPDHMQQWHVPSSEPGAGAQGFLFRPPGEGPFRLALIAHASNENVLRRSQMPQPEYRAFAAWPVARGFAVLVPERPGQGAAGGSYREDQGSCETADYSRAGRATAEEIAAALGYMNGQPFVRPEGVVVLRHSAGGWGALALAAQNPPGVAAIIAFAPGRGGRANNFPNQVCAPHTLMSSAAEFGQTARVPLRWLVAANDSYFSAALSKQLAEAFRRGGDQVDFRVLPASGNEGHWLAETEAGVKIAALELKRALKSLSPIAARTR